MPDINKFDKLEEVGSSFTSPVIGSKGWLVPYLLILDGLHLKGRWAWWSDTFELGHLPDTPIPQLDFLDYPNPETMKHLNMLVDICSSHVGPWRSVEWIMDEILFGLDIEDGHGNVEPWPGARDRFCREFGLQLLTEYPYDYFGHLIAEGKGKGPHWNPNAFYPTPMNVCKMMVGITMKTLDVGGDWKDMAVRTVHDPCVGSGRMLMFASNQSLQLSGQDIDDTVLKACKINGMLYMPWLMRTGTGIVKEIDEYNQRVMDEG
jgi:hypothetical protein